MLGNIPLLPLCVYCRNAGLQILRGCSGWNIRQLIRQVQYDNAATCDRDCMGGVAGDRRLGGVGGGYGHLAKAETRRILIFLAGVSLYR